MPRPIKDAQGAGPKLEEILALKDTLNPFDLVRVRHCMKDSHINMATAIMFLGVVPVDELARIFRERFSIRHIDLESTPIQSRFRNLIPVEKTKAWQVFPLNLIDDSGQKILLLGMTDPFDTACIRKVEALCHLKVQPAFLDLESLQKLLRKYFRSGLDIFPPEITYYGENTVKRRMEAVTRSKGTPPPLKKGALPDLGGSKVVSALVSLLVKKGVFSVEEFEAELSE